MNALQLIAVAYVGGWVFLGTVGYLLLRWSDRREAKRRAKRFEVYEEYGVVLPLRPSRGSDRGFGLSLGQPSERASGGLRDAHRGSRP